RRECQKWHSANIRIVNQCATIEIAWARQRAYYPRAERVDAAGFVRPSERRSKMRSTGRTTWLATSGLSSSVSACGADPGGEPEPATCDPRLCTAGRRLAWR